MNLEIDRRGLLAMGGGLAAAVGLGGLLTACGSGSSSGASSKATKYSFGPPTGSTPKKGGTGTIGVLTGGPGETLDVRRVGINPDVARAYSVYDYLFYVDLTSETGLRPGLALEATSNADATVWHLKLRQGVVFHNGKPLTAKDVVYTIQHSWGSPVNSINSVIKPFVDFAHVKADGDYGVVIPLTRPLAEFPTITVLQTCGIVPEGYTDWATPMGTGAYKMGTFVPGKRSEFAANTNWWGDGPYLDSLVFDTSFTDPQALVNALLAGNVDIVPMMPPALGEAYANSGKIVLGNQPGNVFQGAVFRPDMAPYTNPDVVSAMKAAFNSQQVVDNVYRGYATPGNNIVGHGDPHFASSIKPSYDPDLAKSIVKKAGLRGTQLSLNSGAVDSQTNAMAAVVQQNLNTVGFDCKIKQWSPANYLTDAAGYGTRAFGMDSWINATNSLTLFNLTYWVTGAPWQVMHWGSPAHDAQIYAAMAETNPQRANEKWLTVQKDQAAHGGMLTVNQNFLDGYGTKVRGVKTTTAGFCDGFLFSGMWLDD